MKKNLQISFYCFFILWTSLGCSNFSAKLESQLNNILINQVGYSAADDKIALLKVDAPTFVIKNTRGRDVYEGSIEKWRSWELSGDSVRIAEFSDLTTPGVYSLWSNDSLLAYPIVIGVRPYKDLALASFKSFYLNRSGMDIDSLYGYEYARLGGHPDTAVYIHSSAADLNRSEGTIISSPGGWYDAGDYGKYIVNSGISTYTLLLTYALNPAYHQSWNANIPESENEMPDILDEALYNLHWMLTMQDSADGGVYHKLTAKAFTDFILPHEAKEKRYVMQKSISATLDFAATMAYASRIFSPLDDKLPGFSNRCRECAIKAWNWALLNPERLYKQPVDISTGAYEDNVVKDEWYWAAAELYLTTGEESYSKMMQTNYTKPITPKWDVVGTLGIISLLTSDTSEDFTALQNDFIYYVDELIKIEKSSSYRVSLNEFAWGSNSDVANQGMLKILAHHFTHNEKYYNSALNDLDYLLGRNATGYCFVTGFGQQSPMDIHHRPSAADPIKTPVPGFLVGGPNAIVLNDCGDDVNRSTYPAKSYIDAQCSYSTNEIAINWNAPLVLLTTSIDAYVNKN